MSDSTFKTNIEPLSADTASSILNQLNTYTYNFDTAQVQNSANMSQNMEYGLLAQEVEKVAPTLVLNTIMPAVLDSAGIVITPAKPVKMINYMGIIPLLIRVC